MQLEWGSHLSSQVSLEEYLFEISGRVSSSDWHFLKGPGAFLLSWFPFFEGSRAQMGVILDSRPPAFSFLSQPPRLHQWPGTEWGCAKMLTKSPTLGSSLHLSLRWYSAPSLVSLIIKWRPVNLAGRVVAVVPAQRDNRMMLSWASTVERMVSLRELQVHSAVLKDSWTGESSVVKYTGSSSRGPRTCSEHPHGDSCSRGSQPLLTSAVCAQTYVQIKHSYIYLIDSIFFEKKDWWTYEKCHMVLAEFQYLWPSQPRRGLLIYLQLLFILHLRKLAVEFHNLLC